MLRLDGHVLKAYGRDRQYGGALAGLLASQRTPVPAAALAAAFPELRLTVQQRLKGDMPDDAGAVAREAGELTRDLQRANVSGLERIGARVPPRRRGAEGRRRRVAAARSRGPAGGRCCAS